MTTAHVARSSSSPRSRCCAYGRAQSEVERLHVGTFLPVDPGPHRSRGVTRVLCAPAEYTTYDLVAQREKLGTRQQRSCAWSSCPLDGEALRAALAPYPDAQSSVGPGGAAGPGAWSFITTTLPQVISHVVLRWCRVRASASTAWASLLVTRRNRPTSLQGAFERSKASFVGDQLAAGPQ